MEFKRDLSEKEELEMWVTIAMELLKIPERYRSMNHTSYLVEVENRISNLEREAEQIYDND